MLARQRDSGRALSFGTSALEMAADRSDEVELSWPLGIERLADTGAAEQFLRQVIFRVVGRLLFSRHEVMLGVSAELSTESRRALLQVAMASGARMAHMMDLPLAVALGAGLPIASWTPLPVIFLLPESAQMAVVCHEGLLAHRAISASAAAWDEDLGLEALGDLVRSQIDDLPQPVRERAVESGIALAGRGLSLAAIGERLRDASGLPVRLLADPSHCVAKGTEVALARIESLGSEGLLYLR